MIGREETNQLYHKAEKAHWDNLWDEVELPSGANPDIGGIRNLFVRRMDQLFHQIIKKPSNGKRLLELGCGTSIWLPYFAKQFGVQVSGIDYSDRGCKLAEEILRKDGVTGHVYQCDFFDPPDQLLESFDIVYSAGVVEHFYPTEFCIERFAKYLAPGGLMITIVPNMTGLTGLLQRKFNRPVYDMHVPLSLEALNLAHEAAGLRIEQCRYHLSTGCIVSTSGLPPRSLSTVAKVQLVAALRRLSALIWSIEDKTFRLPETQLLSPFVVCVARKS